MGIYEIEQANVRTPRGEVLLLGLPTSLMRELLVTGLVPVPIDDEIGQQQPFTEIVLSRGMSVAQAVTMLAHTHRHIVSANGIPPRFGRTPTTWGGLAVFDHLPPASAVAQAWTNPGIRPRYHAVMTRAVRDGMPVLARNLDRLVRGDT
jgi:hypothetical protein